MKVKSEVAYTLYDAISALQYWLRFLLKQWIVLLAIGIAGAGVGVLYAWLKKPIYTAELIYVAESDNPSSLAGYAGIAAQFGVDLGMAGGGAFTGENLGEFLKSRASVERALMSKVNFNGKQILLIDYYLHINKIDKGLTDKKLLQQVNFHGSLNVPNRVRDSVLMKIEDDIIKGGLTIDKRDKKLDYYSAKMQDNDEFFAKVFLDNLASNALTFYVNYKSAKARQNVEILQKQADSVRRILFGNIEQVAVGNDLNINPLRQVVKTGVQRRQIDVQVSGAVYTELVKNLELSKITLQRETPFIQIIDAPKFPLEKKKPGRLKTGVVTGILFGFMGVIFLTIREALRNGRKNEDDQKFTESIPA